MAINVHIDCSGSPSYSNDFSSRGVLSVSKALESCNMGRRSVQYQGEEERPGKEFWDEEGTLGREACNINSVV